MAETSFVLLNMIKHDQTKVFKACSESKTTVLLRLVNIIGTVVYITFSDGGWNMLRRDLPWTQMDPINRW